MQFIDAAEIDHATAYKLLVGCVVPRPIAWVTTRAPDGKVNAAPFSCYTFVSHNPPMVAVNMGNRGDGTHKDSCANIRRTREFVVNVVSEDLLVPMHDTSAELPPEVSEIEAFGIETAGCAKIGVPRIAAAPVALECRLDQIIEVGRQPSNLILGEVLAFHIRDDLLVNGRIDSAALKPLARLGGPFYAQLGEIIKAAAPGG